MKRLALILCLTASVALADGCPEAPDNEAALDALFAELDEAANASEAQAISNRMWELWLIAPDAPSQAMLDEGMIKRAFDSAAALERLNALVSYCPFYAEGYNQRAIVHFLREDYAAALPELDRALALNPRHVGALSGRALTLLRMGREEDGQRALRDALALNKWLSERALLRPLPDEKPTENP